jgi:dolichyl-diphosphooligosaccharide--protein glycosyltransferase
MRREDADSSSPSESFVDEFEEGESAIQASLDVDDATETWSFDDIAVDSGTFGELVARGIVEEHDGDYRLSNPDNVRAVLADEEPTTVSSDTSPTSLELPDFDRDYRALAGLFVSLAIVGGARMTGIERAFQNGYAISPSNDPYYFRYWLDRLLTESSGITDFAILNNGVFTGNRPFTHATNWFLAELLGGGEWAATTVAMWLPVLAAVILGAILYKLSLLLTRDPRVGIATVLMFAVTPGNVTYTSLGFFDHSYNQYLWLGGTLLTMGWLAIDLRRRVTKGLDRRSVSARLSNWKTWLVVGCGGLSIAFGTHAWGGSPLLLIPLAVYIGLRVPLEVRAGHYPVRTLGPTVSAVALGGIVSFALHTALGWHSTFVALTPLLVAGGSIVVTALGELWQRQSLQTRWLFPMEIGITAVGSYLFIFHILDDPNRVISRAGDLLFRSGAVETESLFADGLISKSLLELGIPFFIAIGVIGWVAVRLWQAYEPGWLLIGTYTLILIATTGIQVRFAGQLAIPVSILAGFGIIYGLATIGLIRKPFIMNTVENETTTTSREEDSLERKPSIIVPDQRRILYLAGVGIVLFSVSLISLTGTVGFLSYEATQVDAMTAIDTHSEQVNREYPENYVLSPWGRNRMYNYFVNGEGESYGYARRNYDSFTVASDLDGWYERFRGRVGYVVMSNLNTVRKSSNPPAHYQLLYTNSEGSLAAYAVVPGAQIVGESVPGNQVVLNTSVPVNGRSLTREWTVTAGEDGRYNITVPYSGRYRVEGQTVTVPSAAVMNGTRVTA